MGTGHRKRLSGGVYAVAAWFCARYPKRQEAAHDHWCGEWRERERDPMDPGQR